MTDTPDTTTREKLRALYRVATFRPALTAALVFFSVATAALESVGLSFIVPIIATVQADGASAADTDGLVGVFTATYARLGIPFTLAYLVAGVIGVMAVRFTASFLIAWVRARLTVDYLRYLQLTAYDRALGAQVSYFENEGSDKVLNAIVTQSTYASGALGRAISILEELLLIGVYFAIALYLAPELTLGTVVILGGVYLLIRETVESGYEIGSRVADANERIQQYAQAGTQGIRDVKVFGLTGEFRERFRTAVDQYAAGQVTGSRNESAIANFYQFLAATAVFVLIYLSLTVAGLSLAAMGLFLFAMFRLVPRISSLNGKVYRLDRALPHLVRTQTFIDELAEQEEPRGSAREGPPTLEQIAFEDVSFSYDTTENALRGVSFSIERDEFVAFVGPSGAGKSTIASLIARLYEPTSGCITANGTRIDEFDAHEWRSKVAIVRQQPYIFDDTLRWNVTVGDRDATQADIQRACEAAQVTEFLGDLPNGYETVIGDDGVRLSGGQRQRVAIARALLKESDVLVLDEATSDLDATLEARIHDAIFSETDDALRLVIAHRLSTITNADRIHVMKDGRIVSRGDHSTLIDGNETYADLYETQIR